MKKIVLYNPPGGLWLRGEARCEQDLESATAYTVTAPTTLCYMAAIFREKGIEPKIVDCPVEQITSEGFQQIVSDFAPDMAIMNASVLNLLDDLRTVDAIRDMAPNIINGVVLPYFNSLPLQRIKAELFTSVDLILVGEMESLAYDIADYLNGIRPMTDIRGIILRDSASGAFAKTPSIPPVSNLDALPMPARDLICNKLYIRPDVGRPMASIVDGRGCPSSCIYCLAPITTGRMVRKRSVESVVSEIEECVEHYGISDFLFRSDAFTINRAWVLEFCKAICERHLAISWAANSKTSTFDREVADAMKTAGCFIVEFGIESGSDRSLRLQKKGTTIAQALSAVEAAREAGLLTYGTVLIGFPWEDWSDLHETEDFVKSLALDFIEVHVVAPYEGTELYDMMLADGLIEGDTVGYDMISNPVAKGTRHVSRDDLVMFRKGLLRRFYMRPSYMVRTLSRLTSFKQLRQYAIYGIRLLKSLLIDRHNRKTTGDIDTGK